jgi:hypothetical protein
MARLVPKSQKAKRILQEHLKGEPRVEVQERRKGALLLKSPSGSFALWVDLKKSRDWEVIL